MSFFESEFREFSVAMDKHEVEVRRLGNEFKQKIALQILTGVVMLTRVDTGRARGGWQVTVNKPSERVLKTSDKNGSATIKKGTNKVLDSEEGEDIWVTNNVSYIKYLNYGTDKIVGDHMVERTLSRVQSQTE